MKTQQQIVAQLDAQMQVLEGLRKMKVAAEGKIKKILGEIWGVEFVEDMKVEEDA